MTPLADELETYFKSGNDVPVERATIPAALANRIIEAMREFEITGGHLYCTTCGSCGEDGCCPPHRCYNTRLDQAAELLRDAKPLSDEGNGLKWMLDVRAWLAAHDG